MLECATPHPSPLVVALTNALSDARAQAARQVSQVVIELLKANRDRSRLQCELLASATQVARLSRPSAPPRGLDLLEQASWHLRRAARSRKAAQRLIDQHDRRTRTARYVRQFAPQYRQAALRALILSGRLAPDPIRDFVIDIHSGPAPKPEGDL